LRGGVLLEGREIKMSETNSNNDPIVIVSAKRSAIAGFQGGFSTLSASELGGAAIKAVKDELSLNDGSVDNVIMGCVLQAGQGQAPARQASFAGGFGEPMPCVTLNKMCGSGLQAVMYAHDLIKADTHKAVIAGGMESMTNAPYLLPKARSGMRMGHGEVQDHMFLDGLEDAYDRGKLMGVFADNCAAHYNFSREAQDEYALTSLARAKAAIASGAFRSEITPVTISTRKGDIVIDTDEQPGNAMPDKIPLLKPAFGKDGTVTAANASSISDGGAALLVMKASEAQKRGLTPLVKILAHSVHARAPQWFTTAPVGAIQNVLDKLGLNANDIDLYEINEAFAVVTMAAMREFDLPHDKVNINGGACALGHPIGASGARILVTLIHALKNKGLKTGIASLCIGGGEAVALAVENWEG
jgi:acetyl-CoA C-acetyltransferase